MELHKLRKDPDAPDDINVTAAHYNLLSVRRKYDNANKQREEAEKKISDLEEERLKFQKEHDEYALNKEKGNKKVKQLEETLAGCKLQVEESDIEKKILNSMRARLKSDKIVYDHRKFEMEKELVAAGKYRANINKGSEESREEEDRTRKVYSRLVGHLAN